MVKQLKGVIEIKEQRMMIHFEYWAEWIFSAQKAKSPQFSLWAFFKFGESANKPGSVVDNHSSRP